MATWLNDFTTTDVDYTIDTYDAGPPKIHWHNSPKQTRMGGFFYAKADRFTDELDAPWEPSDLYASKGEDGYQTSMLRIAIIGSRKQPFRMDGDRFTWLPNNIQWERGIQYYTELLIFAEGIDHIVVWPSRGLTSKAVNGIQALYREKLLRDGERQAKKKLPLWSFWLPISTELDDHGRIVYRPTGYGNNTVTPPALHLPSDNMDACRDELFVGAEMLRWGQEVREEYDLWLKTKRGVDQHTDEANIAQAATDGSDDEAPF